MIRGYDRHCWWRRMGNYWGRVRPWHWHHHYHNYHPRNHWVPYWQILRGIINVWVKNMRRCIRIRRAQPPHHHHHHHPPWNVSFWKWNMVPWGYPPVIAVVAVAVAVINLRRLDVLSWSLRHRKHPWDGSDCDCKRSHNTYKNHYSNCPPPRPSSRILPITLLRPPMPTPPFTMTIPIIHWPWLE